MYTIKDTATVLHQRLRKKLRRRHILHTCEINNFRQNTIYTERNYVLTVL